MSVPNTMNMKNKPVARASPALISEYLYGDLTPEYNHCSYTYRITYRYIITTNGLNFNFHKISLGVRQHHRFLCVVQKK